MFFFSERCSLAAQSVHCWTPVQSIEHCTSFPHSFVFIPVNMALPWLQSIGVILFPKPVLLVISITVMNVYTKHQPLPLPLTLTLGVAGWDFLLNWFGEKNAWSIDTGPIFAHKILQKLICDCLFMQNSQSHGLHYNVQKYQPSNMTNIAPTLQ